MGLCVVAYGCLDNLTGSKKTQYPVIDHLYARRSSILTNDTVIVKVEARDLNGERLQYVWDNFNLGTFIGDVTIDSVRWKAPNTGGNYFIEVNVANTSHKVTTDSVTILVATVTTPIITIASPSNNQFIPASLDSITISVSTTPPQIDSMKCLVNNVVIGRTGAGISSANFKWHIRTLNGPQAIKIQAWTHNFGPSTLGESLINVSIEGTIGKQK
jgi:hypothetical protein